MPTLDPPGIECGAGAHRTLPGRRLNPVVIVVATFLAALTTTLLILLLTGVLRT
ncbi:MAG: hypothetical protein PV358_05215 [Acidimicrobiales bacterium]|nr:hypothetical protein [Acidimicrobiales bacterium]